MEEITLETLWAKTAPFQSVKTHAIVTGTVAQTLLEDYLSAGTRQLLCRSLSLEEDAAIRFVGYLASLHDIGKIEPHFQAKDAAMRAELQQTGMILPGLNVQGVRHEDTTRYILREIWENWVEYEDIADFYADILASHHQQTGSGRKKTGVPWKSLQQELEQAMRLRFLESNAEKLPEEFELEEESRLSALLLGIVVLSDWSASGTLFSDAEEWIHDDNAPRMIQDKTRKFLAASGLAHQVVVWGESFCGVWPNIPAGGLRSLQQQTQQLFAQTRERISLVLMEAPMGEGKTEAGLYAALQMARQWGKDGFYVALPTAATANQMVDRMRQLLELHRCEDQVKLLHSMAWLTEDVLRFDPSEELAEARRWLQPRKRGLLAPYAVGTVDQVMMAVCRVKFGALRLLGLAQKVLIIDEIHSYDVYMSRFLHLLLQWCKALEIPVVLLSATLPPEKKKELLKPYCKQDLPAAYPAITAITEQGEPVTLEIPNTAQRKPVSVELSPHLHEPEEIAYMANELTADGGCICVLLNTVDQAQAVYLSLKAQHSDAKLLLFHARFPAKRRAEIERECVQLFGKDKSCRPKRAILVATQVVEQSLDVDFDAMISSFAPVDLILQRMGRIHRHGDTVRPAARQIPKMILLAPAEEGFWEVDKAIYPDCLLNQAYHLLRQRQQVRIPEDMQSLVADGYDIRKAPPGELEKWLENKVKDQISAASGMIYQIDAPDGRPYSGVKTSSFAGGPFEDEGEDNGFLTAKTRLSEPTVTLALLNDELFAAYQNADKPVSMSLMRNIMEQSVSIMQKRIYGNTSVLLDKDFDKNMYIKVIHLQNGCAALPNQQILHYDPEIGVQIVKDGDYGKAQL